jgi:tRNA uridine 5-carboxymethylaminomethyl modification enzyme
MFTSRAEHRLLLRIDNADLRLTPKGRDIGLVHDDRWERFESRRGRLEELERALASATVQAGDSPARIPAVQRLRQPGVGLAGMAVRGEIELAIDADSALYDFPTIETSVKYEGYLKRELAAVERSRKQEARRVPRGFPYERIAGLSREMVQRFGEVEPQTLGQAGRIPGVTPAAVALLGAYLDRWADDATGVQRSAGEAGP